MFFVFGPTSRYASPSDVLIREQHAGFERRQRAVATTLLISMLLGLACYRLTPIRTGHFFWADERCYLPALDFVDALGRADFREAAVHLFQADGPVPPARPGFVLISSISVLAQKAYAHLFGTPIDLPASYDLVAAFNALTTLAVSWTVFALARSWTGNAYLALLAALVHALLAGSNVWIRHLVPYQLSLLFLLWGLLLPSKYPGCHVRRRGEGMESIGDGKKHGHLPGAMPTQSWAYSGRRSMATQARPCHPPAMPPFGMLVAAGLLSGFGYACYPGHYAGVIINGAAAIATSRRRLAALATFGGAAASVLLLFEGVARWAGRSYLADLKRLSGSVSMGDPAEGFFFLWHYLRDVEPPVGPVLLALFLVAVILVVRHSLSRDSHLGPQSPASPCAFGHVLLAAVGCYALHATLGLLNHRTVFYGRLLLPFMPIVVVGAVLTIASIRPPLWRAVMTCTLLACSAVSFGRFAGAYAKVVYPADFLQDTMLAKLGRKVTYPSNALWGRLDRTTRGSAESVDFELVLVADTRAEGSREYATLLSHVAASETEARFIGVNFKYLGYIAERETRFQPSTEYRLVAEAPHPEAFPAMGYEGRKPWERRRLHERQYTMRLYERDPRGDPRVNAPLDISDFFKPGNRTFKTKEVRDATPSGTPRVRHRGGRHHRPVARAGDSRIGMKRPNAETARRRNRKKTIRQSVGVFRRAETARSPGPHRLNRSLPASGGRQCW